MRHRRETKAPARQLIGPAALVLLLASGSLRAAEPIDGSAPACVDFRAVLGTIGLFDFCDVQYVCDIPDEGWTWVSHGDPSQPTFREVSGLVVGSFIATTDTPANHNSHDQGTEVQVDPGQEGLLSLGNHEGVIEVEWETGIRPSEKSGDGANPGFRKQAWPNVGDRYWAEGHWVFDCGHTTDVNGVDQFATEIHPARAAATMRPIAHPLPGTGATPVPVTLTDLYIHGRGGYVVDQLACGMDIMLADDPNSCATHTTPIDKDFRFNVCLPRRPAPQAILAWFIEEGAGNTLSPALLVEEVPADAGCGNSGDHPLDLDTMLRVTAPLGGSGAAPEDVYARRLYAGWIFPPDPPLRHLSVALKSMHLDQDHETDPGNGELSFLWLNLDRDRDPWRRLSDFDIPTADDSGIVCGADHINTLEDYDDDGSCGNGELRFAGPAYDFYVRNGESFHLRTKGFEQDCFDDHFGDHHFSLAMYLACFGGNPFEVFNWGDNDQLSSYDATLGPGDTPPYGIGGGPISTSDDFFLRADIEELPLSLEDLADLGVTLQCTHSGEVALLGEPLTCAVRGANSFGPGLPRGATLEASTSPLTAVIAPASFTLTSFNVGSASGPCNPPHPGGITCGIGTVPAGGVADVPLSITPSAPGSLVTRAEIAAASGDGNTANNSAEAVVEVYLAITLDIRPDSDSNPVNVGHGLIPVAILTRDGLDATRVDVATLCFGDAGSPAQRDCTEKHSSAHFSDVDHDGRLDAVLHYEAAETGIDLGDTSACLIGRLSDGTGIFGCDTVVTH